MPGSFANRGSRRGARRLAAAVAIAAAIAILPAGCGGQDDPQDGRPPASERTRFGAAEQAALHKAAGFYSQGEYGDAFEAAKAALTTGVDSTPAYDLISRIYIDSGQDPQAVEFFTVATEDLGSAPAFYYLGFHQFRLSRWDEAVAAFRRASELDPVNADIRFREGLVLKARGDFEGAVVALTKAQRLGPDRPEIAAELARYLRITGDYEGSRRVIEESLQRMPEDGMLLYAAAQLHLRENEYKRAESLLRRAVQLRPDLREAHHDLSRVLALTGDEAGARDAQRVYRRLSDYVETLSSLAKKIGRNPKDPKPLLTAAELHLSQQRWAEALRAASRAEDLDANPLRVACIRAEGYFGSRAAALAEENLAKAEQLLQETEESGAHAPATARSRVALSRATALMSTGKIEEAPPLLASAGAADAPKDRLFHLRVGDAWRNLGQEAESRAAYDRAYSYPRPR